MTGGVTLKEFRHDDVISALLAFSAGNSPVTGEFPAQRPVTRSFYDFFDLRSNQQLNKQWRRGWFETPRRSLWRNCNALYVKRKCRQSYNLHLWILSRHPVSRILNTLRLRQNGRHFPDDIFKWIFLYENLWISIKNSLKFVSSSINNIPVLVQIMDWGRPGDKPLS